MLTAGITHTPTRLEIAYNDMESAEWHSGGEQFTRWRYSTWYCGVLMLDCIWWGSHA